MSSEDTTLGGVSDRTRAHSGPIGGGPAEPPRGGGRGPRDPGDDPFSRANRWLLILVGAVIAVIVAILFVSVVSTGGDDEQTPSTTTSEPTSSTTRETALSPTEPVTQPTPATTEPTLLPPITLGDTTTTSSMP